MNILIWNRKNKSRIFFNYSKFIRQVKIICNIEKDFYQDQNYKFTISQQENLKWN